MGLLGKLIRFITGQTRSGRISPKVELNNLPALKTFILEPIITPSGVVDSSHFSEPLFESGFFTVGAKGEVGVDYLFDGGGYEGELAIFSLKDLEQYDVSTSQGLHDFIQVVAERALSDSELGHIVISDAAEGARFSGIFPSEWHDWNAGEYQGVKTFNMHPGDTFGVMLVPNATVQELYDNPDAGGAVRPLFSMVTANPSEAFHLGQAVDVNGKATTFVLEDQRFDQGSDHDYEDIIFQFHGATGKAANMDNFVNHDVDWRGSELGQKLIEFIKPPANQPLIGIIDTGITADNPDLDPYHIHFGNHADLVAGDGNPLLQPGEGSEHGTHIAGIIAATQDNGLGIDGINDQAPLYISRATGSGNWAQGLVDFVDAAKESGQPHAIANLSLDLTQINHDGSVTTRYEFTPFEREALEYARQNHVLIVAAAGNDGDVMSVLGQASQEFDNIITTGAAKHLDIPSDHTVPIAEAYDRADYSSYGYGLDILADGGTVENPILSTVGDGLGTLAGTSVATAQVTGAASLVWAANPDLDYRQVIEILKSTATDLKTPGWDLETGSGLLNIAAAVELARVSTPRFDPSGSDLISEIDGTQQEYSLLADITSSNTALYAPMQATFSFATAASSKPTISNAVTLKSFGKLSDTSNFRNYPWVDSSTLIQSLMPAGTIFTILQKVQTNSSQYPYWYKVRLTDGREGYFYSQYVTETASLTGTVKNTSDIRNAGGLAVRSTPGGTTLITRLQPGASLKFDDWTIVNGVTWFRIQSPSTYNGKAISGAWVSGSNAYIDINSSSTAYSNFSRNVKAFLDTIAFAEGTNGADGYRTLYSYQKFESFSGHPRKKICAGNYCSTAAGRYQFLDSTWDGIWPNIGATDFSPWNQDRAAVYLINQKGALTDIENGKFENAVNKLNVIWASLPGSPYGQPTKSMQQLKSFYQQSLLKY